jgi:endonuclease-3
MTSDDLRVTKIVRRLERYYGECRRPKRRAKALDVLVRTILSQNTSDVNSHAAFDQLKRRFSKWEEVKNAPTRSIEAAIRRAGLSRIKAPRIKSILQEIESQRGNLSLKFLTRWPRERAYEYLLTLTGIGPKTAACVLLFAFGKPVLPVDTHILRVSKRIGLIGAEVNAEKAHKILGEMVPEDKVYAFHILLIEHGRTLCVARNPKCPECPLLEICNYGKRYGR